MASTSLTGVNDALLPLDLPDFLADQVTYIVTIVARKNQSLTFVWVIYHILKCLFR